MLSGTGANGRLSPWRANAECGCATSGELFSPYHIGISDRADPVRVHEHCRSEEETIGQR
jgi:hypothetical protein